MEIAISAGCGFAVGFVVAAVFFGSIKAHITAEIQKLKNWKA